MMSPAAWTASLPRIEELAASLPNQLTIVGSNTKGVFQPRLAAPLFSTRHWSGIIEHDVEDQVAVVWAGTPISELQSELRKHGQCLALPDTGHRLIDGIPGTLGGLVAANLPHGLTGLTRSPRDWVLGMTLIRADGAIARAGTKAVKSVAGYDIHRFLAGSWGTLALIAAVALRLHPVRGLPATRAEALQAWNGESVWIQRVARSDYEVARSSGNHLFAADPDSATLWHAAMPFRFSSDWLIGPDGFISPHGVPTPLATQARAVLDPHRRFNPHIIP